MADFTQTINNTIEIFGGKQTSNWGVMLWGEKWAYGTNELLITIGKVLDSTITLTDQISDLSVGFFQTISNTITVDADMYLERLTDSNNWSKLWGASTNAESRPATSYNINNDVTTSFTAQADVTTSWSEQ